jgi:hypothetical protein
LAIAKVSEKIKEDNVANRKKDKKQFSDDANIAPVKVFSCIFI